MVSFGAACCMSVLGVGLVMVAVIAGGWLTPRLAEKILTTKHAKITLDVWELEQFRADHARCSAEAGALRQDVAALQRGLQTLQRESAAEIDALKLSFAGLQALVGKSVVGAPAELAPPPPESAAEGSSLKHGGSNSSAPREVAAAVVKHGVAGDPPASDQASADLGAGRGGVAPRRRLGKHTFGLWRSGMKCSSSGEDDEKELGQKDSSDACREACVKKAKLVNESCNLFLYGRDGDCRWEKDSACVSGEFEELNTYSIYKVNDFFEAGHMCHGEEDERHHEHCNESLSGNGADYRGCQDRTRSGRMCQRWSSQFPHTHARTSQYYPDSGLTSNYCRNPDGEETIWCYTEDPKIRFEFCEPHFDFLEHAGVNSTNPQPHELFIAIEIALERNDPSLLWQASSDAKLMGKLVGVLGKLDYRTYQRAPVEAQYAFLAAATAWFGNLTDLTQGGASLRPPIRYRIIQDPLLSLLVKTMVTFQYGTDVPGSWSSNWKFLAGLSNSRVQEAAWTDVLTWAKELAAGEGIRLTLVQMFSELPSEIVQAIHADQFHGWDGLTVARRWANAVSHYNISGACNGHPPQQDTDYWHIFGKSPHDRRKVLAFQSDGKTLLMRAVSNCKCLCRCNDEGPQHEVCSRVIEDLMSHYENEEVAIDTMESDSATTAAMLAARSGAPQVARTLRYTMLDQSYRKFEEETGTRMRLLHIADLCNVNTLFVFTVVIASATACFKVLQEDFSWKHPFEHNTGYLLRMLLLMGINLTIEYAFDVFPMLWSGEADIMLKFQLILETPWNVSTEAINIAVLTICTVGLVGYFVDHGFCTRSCTSAETVQPTDIYQDPGVSVSQCLVGMTAASCLFLIYLSYFTTPISMTLSGRFYWLLAVLMQCKLAIPEHGAQGSTTCQWLRCSTSDTRNPELWATLLAGKALRLTEGEKHIKPPSVYEVYMRMLFSYISNTVFRSVIIYTLPLYLAASSEEPLDFVLNACALTFIYEYDDLQDSRTYEVLDESFANDQSESSDASGSDREVEKLPTWTSSKRALRISG